MPATPFRNRREKVIWAAAFFEGEGCILIRRNAGQSRQGFFLQIQVAQKIPTALSIFNELWGGGQWGDGNGLTKWICSGSIAADAITEMLPYLVAKKAQAKLALKFQDFRSPANQWTPKEEMERRFERDFEFYAEMRQMKR